MMDFLAAAPTTTFWSGQNGSNDLWIKIILGLIFGLALIFILVSLPIRARRPIIALVTFLAGGFYVVYYLWPRPIDRDPGELPQNPIEAGGFWLEDALPVIASFTNILTGMLLGLGIYSLFRVHGRRLVKLQKDWFFSLTLLGSMILMVLVGYMDWTGRKGPDGPKLAEMANWGNINYVKDFMFDGLLQQMDAAMFSIIAFYILSAAYRAFRIRSIEATILLATALVVILALMGAPEMLWTGSVINNIDPNPDSFVHNFTLTNISGWLTRNLQTPSIRGIDFGVGIGALAMGLRLWLSLEKSGTSA